MSTPSSGPFAESTPLGLIGLAIGCAALTPIAFGLALTPAAFSTAAWMCLLFGAGGQLLAGLMALANKNMHGGTLFTAFAFNWVMNWHVLSDLSKGIAPDHTVLLATDMAFLLVFLVLTYGFGLFSKLLFLFLLDIDLMYVFKILSGLTGSGAFALPIALCTVALGLIALWIAFAMLINPIAGRAIFAMPGPMFQPAPPKE